jgi:linoleoyl-CoA desaturase
MGVHRSSMAISMNQVRFNSADQRLQQDLKSRVDAYFAYTGLKRTATPSMWAQAVFWMGGTAALLALLSSGALPALVAWPLAGLLGVFMAATGFNVGHDAIHGAFSNNRMINGLLSFTFDVSGASSYTWSNAHNFVHHTYTNVPGVDHDLDPGPFMVFTAKENPHWIYRFQHIYSFVLYFFTYIVWVFKKDFQQIAAPDPRTGKSHPTARKVEVVVGKLTHFALFLVLPLLLSDYAPWQVAIGYFSAIAVAGLTLAVVFQLAHVVEGTDFPLVDADNRLHDSWAVHQLRTTANFAPESAWWNFFTGGLNHQVEHHLLYKIAHCHYPALAPIVRDVAARHGVPYHEFPTFPSALGAHVRMMKRFGAGIPQATSNHADDKRQGNRSEPLPAE